MSMICELSAVVKLLSHVPGKNTRVDIAVSFSRGFFWPRDWIHIPVLAGRFFTTKPPGKSCGLLTSGFWLYLSLPTFTFWTAVCGLYFCWVDNILIILQYYFFLNHAFFSLPYFLKVFLILCFCLIIIKLLTFEFFHNYLHFCVFFFNWLLVLVDLKLGTKYLVTYLTLFTPSTCTAE